MFVNRAHGRLLRQHFLFNGKMGNHFGHYSTRLKTYVHTSSGQIFRFSDLDLIEHVLLLRRVIDHPQLIEKGPVLTTAVNEYCYLMGKKQMHSSFQQADIPWSIEWIWHVHRLHPLIYIRDCQEQIPDGLIVDKKIKNFYMKNDPLILPNSTGNVVNQHHVRTFQPSLDLVEAAIRQQNFLRKFQSHPLFSINIKHIDKWTFENAIQNFVSFMKLAQKSTMIVPTFDIDLIWHTTMRYPLKYIELSTALCGRVLDHDDSISSEKLAKSFEDTAQRWKKLYQTEYGHNINEMYVRQSIYSSSCALIYETEDKKRPDTENTLMGSGCGGFWETKSKSSSENEISNGDGGDGGDSGGDGCGGGCGGD